MGIMLRGKSCIYVLFIIRRLQDGYHAKGKKLYICFVDLENAFARVHEKCWNGHCR